MVSFRKATNKDFPTILEIMKKVGYLKLVGEKKSIQRLQECSVYVAEEDKVIGYWIHGPFDVYGKHIQNNSGFPKEEYRKNYAYSLGIAIDPDTQTKGLGTSFALWSLDQAKKEGYKGMFADVHEKNAASLGMVKKIKSFVEIARYPDKERGGKNNVVFRADF